jgi:glycosyltransferase involved in cell wall biosynthesis
MVRDGLNGYIHAGGDVGALKRDLIRIASLDQETREEMGRVSFELSRQYLPELWAERLIREFQEVRIKKL